MEMTDKNLVRVWNVPLRKGEIKVATIEQGLRKPSMCEGCSAPCCQGLLKPILTSEEFLTKKFKFAYTSPEPWFKKKVPRAQYLVTLDIGESGCPYFDKNTSRCSIWPDCPKSCLAYDCREDPRMKEFAKRREREWKRRSN